MTNRFEASASVFNGTDHRTVCQNGQHHGIVAPPHGPIFGAPTDPAATRPPAEWYLGFLPLRMPLTTKPSPLSRLPLYPWQMMPRKDHWLAVAMRPVAHKASQNPKTGFRRERPTNRGLRSSRPWHHWPPTKGSKMTDAADSRRIIAGCGDTWLDNPTERRVSLIGKILKDIGTILRT